MKFSPFSVQGNTNMVNENSAFFYAKVLYSLLTSLTLPSVYVGSG